MKPEGAIYSHVLVKETGKPVGFSRFRTTMNICVLMHFPPKHSVFIEVVFPKRFKEHRNNL